MKTMQMNQPFHGAAWPVELGSDRYIKERSEYRNQKVLGLACTTLGQARPASEQKRIVEEWCEFFEQPNPVRNLALRRQVSQRLFDAVCHIRALNQLHVKWGPVTDLSALRNVRELTGLSLGTTSVTDLSPITALPQLTHLQLDNLKRVVDFKELVACRKLEFLNIEGYPQGPQKVKVKDLRFLRGLTNLKALRIGFAQVKEFDVDDLMNLKNLEYLELPSSGRIEANRLDEFAKLLSESLPKLRFGNVVDRAQATPVE
jgi:Leucine-rich repeat (LRR) protein